MRYSHQYSKTRERCRSNKLQVLALSWILFRATNKMKVLRPSSRKTLKNKIMTFSQRKIKFLCWKGIKKTLYYFFAKHLNQIAKEPFSYWKRHWNIPQITSQQPNIYLFFILKAKGLRNVYKYARVSYSNLKKRPKNLR